MDASAGDFRGRLDRTLRLRDPQALRAFLIAEGQWRADVTTDPERAMWMMIASSPALRDQRAAALGWLSAHGYLEEASTLGGEGGDERGVSPRPGARTGVRRGAARGAKGQRPGQGMGNGKRYQGGHGGRGGRDGKGPARG